MPTATVFNCPFSATPLRAPSAQEARCRMSGIDNLPKHSAPNFRPHREVLADVAPASREDSWQVYFG